MTKLDNQVFPKKVVTLHSVDSRVCQQEIRQNEEYGFYMASKLVLMQNEAGVSQSYIYKIPFEL